MSGPQTGIRHGRTTLSGLTGSTRTSTAAKHGAAHGSVDVVLVNGAVFCTISDDGPGGAGPSAGTGLRGLVERIAAVDGLLTIETPASGGTSLVARIPTAG